MRRLLADDTLLRMHGANGLLTALGVHDGRAPDTHPDNVLPVADADLVQRFRQLSSTD